MLKPGIHASCPASLEFMTGFFTVKGFTSTQSASMLVELWGKDGPNTYSQGVELTVLPGRLQKEMARRQEMMRNRKDCLSLMESIILIPQISLGPSRHSPESSKGRYLYVNNNNNNNNNNHHHPLSLKSLLCHSDMG